MFCSTYAFLQKKLRLFKLEGTNRFRTSNIHKITEFIVALLNSSDYVVNKLMVKLISSCFELTFRTHLSLLQYCKNLQVIIVQGFPT